MTAHSILPPSSAARWTVCPGSVRMERAHPGVGGEAAREGTAAHWVMERAVGIGGPPPALGTVAPNGVPVSQWMLDAAEMLWADVRLKLGPGWHAMVQVERTLQIPRVHPQCFGTPDVYAWQQIGDRRWLHKWDLKGGHGVVDAFENLQLVAYAAGALTEANNAPPPAWPESQVSVSLTIVQPRAYHPDGPVRTWTTTPGGMLPLVQRMHTAAQLALGDDAPLNPQPAACEDCSARGHCPALQRAGLRIMDVAGTAVPHTLGAAALGLELAYAHGYRKLLQARIEGLEEQVNHHMKEGAAVPHWGTERGRGATVWDRPVEEIRTLGDLFGVNVMKPPEPITPLQAKAAGIPEAMLETYARKIPGAVKLVQQSDAAKKVFTAPDL